MSFHEHCERWDSRWHVELMCHAYAWFMQGKNPWDLAGAGSDDSPESTFSHRLNAWNVPLMLIYLNIVSFYVRLFICKK